MLHARAEDYLPLPPERAALWSGYGQWDEVYFPKLIGLQVEEVRADYCRMRLPWRSELTQPAGVVHGGAIAALVDSVVVPAIGSGYDERRAFVTIDMQLQYRGAVVRGGHGGGGMGDDAGPLDRVLRGGGRHRVGPARGQGHAHVPSARARTRLTGTLAAVPAPTTLSEDASKRLLADHGVPVPDERVVATASRRGRGRRPRSASPSW